MRRTTAVVTAVLSTLAVVDGAYASRLPAPLFATSAAVADGSRYIAYGAGAQRIVIRDLRSSRTRVVTTAQPCEIDAASDAHALLNCGREPYQVATLLSLRTGRVRPVPMQRQLNAATVGLATMGRVWVSGSLCEGPCSRLFVNWHDGSITTGSLIDESPVDLDEKDPFRRPPRALYGNAGSTKLVLRTRTRQRQLARCHSTCFSSVLAGSRAALLDGVPASPWGPPTTLRVFDTTTGHRLARWSLSGLGAGKATSALQATPTKLVLSVPRDAMPSSQPGANRFKIYLITWPRRR
jgi:hypothetical protein